jgi:hypothetical protein
MGISLSNKKGHIHTHTHPTPHLDTPRPNPQSQSFSRSYGSILPTSLIYILLSTRGCEPWRPDAVISTNERANKSLARIFKGSRERAGHLPNQGALPWRAPSRRPSRFQGSTCMLKRKDNSSLGPRERLLARWCCHTLSTSRFGNINPIPFRYSGLHATAPREARRPQPTCQRTCPIS